jgi:hypothetical protein
MIIMLNERRRTFIQDNIKRLFSKEALTMLLKDPARLGKAAIKAGRQAVSDVSFADTESLEEIYSSSIAAFRRLVELTRPTSETSFDEWLPVKNNSDGAELAALFRQFGSDKATTHDYYRIYNSVLHRDAKLNILEIGLGTNNIDVPSNMGLWGKPGASLRAFRDWAPNGKIYGADVDRRVLFDEPRISTFWVDQTDRASLSSLVSQLGQVKFDLIIDDGLHLPHANINTLTALLPLLAASGTFVVEDIEHRFEDIWRLAGALIDSRYDSRLVETKSAYAFVLRQRNS